MAPPRAAVVVPAHNAARHLAATLASVRGQTMPDFEVVVVDDGSTDNTRAVAEWFARADRRVRVIAQPQGGVARARNTGWRSTEAPFVGFLDADDLWHPRKLELQLERFAAAGPELGLVYAWTQCVDEDGRLLPRDTIVADAEGDVLAALVESNLVGHASGALLRRECLLEVGGFDESLRARGAQGCEDLAFYLAVAARWRFAVVRDFLVAYRLADGAMSRDVWSMKRSHELVLRACRERHPELPGRSFRRGRVAMNRWLALRTNRRVRDRLPLLWDSVCADPVYPLRPEFLLGVLGRVRRRLWPRRAAVRGPAFLDLGPVRGPEV